MVCVQVPSLRPFAKHSLPNGEKHFWPWLEALFGSIAASKFRVVHCMYSGLFQWTDLICSFILYFLLKLWGLVSVLMSKTIVTPLLSWYNLWKSNFPPKGLLFPFSFFEHLQSCAKGKPFFWIVPGLLISSTFTLYLSSQNCLSVLWISEESGWAVATLHN